MRSSLVPIDPDLLRRRYVNEGLTAEQIAAQLECAPTTVLRRLRRFEIQVRSRGPGPACHGAAASLEWRPELAYALGLMATDGNLSSDRRHITFVSKDLDLVQTFRKCLGVTSQTRPTRSRRGGTNHRVQWCNRRVYDWFIGVGLTPAKSLTLGPLAVPDAFFADFFRGCIDGDGSVLVYTDRYHSAKKEHYVYERLYVSIVSASQAFIEWLQMTASRLTGVAGSITVARKQGRNPIWKLSYAKAESLRVLAWIYHAPDVPCLDRKRVTAERFLLPLGHAPKRPTGRPRVGWLYGSSGIVQENTAGWFPFARAARILAAGEW